MRAAEEMYGKPNQKRESIRVPLVLTTDCLLHLPPHSRTLSKESGERKKEG